LEQPTLSNNNTTTRQRIMEYLARQAKAPQPPVQIAKGTRLNRHTVRRELQQMLKTGTIQKEQHAYCLTKPPDKRAERRMLRELIGRLIDEYVKKDTTYFSEFTDRKSRIECCLRTIDKATVYNGTEEVKQLARAIFGREEHGSLVTYQTTLPEWFIKLRNLLDLDRGLTPTATDEFKRIRNEDREQEILNHLKTDPSADAKAA